MKDTCRKALATLLLVLTLACAALADDGVMTTGGRQPPPPPPPPAAPSTGNYMSQQSDNDWMSAETTQIALSLLQALLPRF